MRSMLFGMLLLTSATVAVAQDTPTLPATDVTGAQLKAFIERCRRT